MVREPTPKYEQEKGFGKAEKEILGFLASKQGKSYKKTIIAAMTGKNSRGGYFANALYRLSGAGLIIKEPGQNFQINEDRMNEVLEVLGPNYEDKQFTIEDWFKILPGNSKKMFRAILDEPSRSFSKEELAEISGSASSGGYFNNGIYKLTGLELVKKTSDGYQLNPELLEV